jgi:hypothetical protein
MIDLLLLLDLLLIDEDGVVGIIIPGNNSPPLQYCDTADKVVFDNDCISIEEEAIVVVLLMVVGTAIAIAGTVVVIIVDDDTPSLFVNVGDGDDATVL